MFEFQKYALHESIVIVLTFVDPANRGFTVKQDAIYTYIRICKQSNKSVINKDSSNFTNSPQVISEVSCKCFSSIYQERQQVCKHSTSGVFAHCP